MPGQRERTTMQEATLEWFDEARFDCFNTLTRVAFLRIFAGPMCVPLNRNYGRENGRSSGRIRRDTRTPEEKWEAQQQALAAYADQLEGWVPQVEDMVGRAADLSTYLATNVFSCDFRYANKWTNYKPEAFLSMFICAEDPVKQMKEVVDFYCGVVRKVFQGMTRQVLDYRYDPLAGDLTRLRNKCRLSDLEVPPEYSGELADKIGWSLCAYLLLAAYSGHQTPEAALVLEQILGVRIAVPDSEETTAVGYGSVFRLNLDQLRVLLIPMGREPKLEELEQVYLVLEQLGDPNRDSVREFMELLQRRVDILLDRCLDDVVRTTGVERVDAVRRLAAATDLFERCGDWLE